MTELSDILHLIENHSYTSDKCFLCGCTLSEKNKSVEHVIPKWLQKHFNLRDQKMFLLNGTSIPYRLLTIPCCKDCNNNHLSPFENKIKAAFKCGYQEFEKIDKETLFLWLGKIYFGIMYRELFLDFDRSNPKEGRIANPEFLKSFNSHFLFLQGIRNLHTYKDFFPASIFLFKTQKPLNIKEQWDYIDSNNTPFISIRMGEIGIIAVLQDCEAIHHHNNFLKDYRDTDLHPLQFREITAQIMYMRFLMNRNPKFIVVQDGPHIQTHLMSLQGLSEKGIFDNWNNDDYAQVLSFVTGIPFEICKPEEDKVYSWIMGPDGKPKYIPVN